MESVFKNTIHLKMLSKHAHWENIKYAALIPEIKVSEFG